MKSSDFKEKYKIMIAVAGGLVFIFIVGIFVFSTVHSKIEQLQLQIRREEANMRACTEIEHRKTEIVADFNKHKEALNAVQSISQQEVMAVFSKEIERIAQESHVSIVALTPQGQDDSVKEYKKYNAELRAEGNQENVYLFLYKVQTSPLFIKLNKISITTKDFQKKILRIETIVSMAVV